MNTGYAVQISLVALGGALGSVLRFVVSTVLNPKMAGLHIGLGFPVGTLTANLVGCFLIGLVFVAMQNLTTDIVTFHHLRSLLIIGVLGGFTTFSSFTLESLHLLQGGLWQAALLNIIASVTLCLTGTAIGIWVGRLITT